MWPPMCIHHCFTKGYYYAGLQNRFMCFCGNSYGKYGSSNSCNQACYTRPRYKCGGITSNSVYTTGLSKSCVSYFTPKNVSMSLFYQKLKRFPDLSKKKFRCFIMLNISISRFLFKNFDRFLYRAHLKQSFYCKKDYSVYYYRTKVILFIISKDIILII